MKDFRIIFNGIKPISLPDGICLGVVGESNVVRLVLTLPESMVDGMDYHVVTIGGVDSARIVGTNVNIEIAYRVGNVIYMPLSSAYTTQRITDLTVTAYKQTGDVVQIIDKTPTVYGLKFDEGQPRPADGGLASEVAALENRVDGLESEVDAIRDDVPTAEEIAAWNEAAADKHTHENKTVLDDITSTSVSHWDRAYDDRHTHANKQILDRFDVSLDYGVTYTDIPIGVPVVSQLPETSQADTPDLCVYDKNLYQAVSDGQGGFAWAQITSGLTPDELAVLERDKHVHENKSTLDKFGESDGEPTFDGNPIGGGVNTYATPSVLPNNAENGSVAVALGDDPSNTIVYPTQTGGEEVSVDISGKSIMIGNPTFNGTAIDSAISAQTVDLTAAVALENPDGMIQFVILPVVSDPDTNEYTAAGITLDSFIQVSSYANKYAIGAMLTNSGIDYINPEKIVDVDANYEKIPFMAIYTFEALSNAEYQGMPMNLSAGWNVALATVDKATHQEITAIEVVDGAVDLNEYLILSDDSRNSMTIEGVGASAIFTNTIVGEAGKKAGLYVRLSGVWSRCTLDGDA